MILLAIINIWEPVHFIELYMLCVWLGHIFTERTNPPLSRILHHLSNLCDAAAKWINHDRGEWGVVIREPQQAEYAPTLVGLPAEVTDMVVGSCEPVPRNSLPLSDADYFYVDRLHRDGKRRMVSGPNMIALAQTNRQLRYCFMKYMFKGKVLHLSHENVERTVDFLIELYPSTRDGIRGLHIEWQRTGPVNRRSFRQLCGIMNNLPRLSILHLTLPVNGRSPYSAILEPGLWNALLWHKDRIICQTIYTLEVMRGFGFSTSRRAVWVQHLLGIRGAWNSRTDGIRDFKLDTVPRAEGAALKLWLESKMTLEWDFKVAAVENIVNERSWFDLMFR